MTQPAVQTIKEIAIANIDLSGRLRPVSANGVSSLLDAIDGQSEFANPIQVRKMRKGYRLIDGAHRVAAALELGWESIQAKVHNCTDVEARLLEIDCNVGGAELTVLDTMVFLAERKRIYVELHPETKRGFVGSKANQGLTVKNTVRNFAASAAEKFGVSESKIFKLVAAGEALTPDNIEALRGITSPLQKGELLAIAKIDNAAARSTAIQGVVSGDFKNLSGAIASVSNIVKPTSDPIEQHHQKLLDAWKRASKEAQRRFLRDVQGDVATILSQFGGDE